MLAAPSELKTFQIRIRSRIRASLDLSQSRLQYVEKFDIITDQSRAEAPILYQRVSCLEHSTMVLTVLACL